MTEERDNEYVNLLKDFSLKPSNQNYELALIFQENIGKWLKKREIEKQFTLRVAFSDIPNNEIENCKSIDEIIEKANNVPGDVQRDLRTFFDKFHKYGLEKQDKDKDNNIDDVSYRWNPIKREQLEDIIHPCARNLLKTDKEIKDFYKLKKNKCEMCGASKKNEQTRRMAIDHFRAHSKYNIDNKCIGVLLCEKCNNIHHNYDACKIALAYKDNLKIVKNWVKKEKEMRDKGFLPNEEDLALQKKVISEIIEYYQDINPINNEFWEGLN